MALVSVLVIPIYIKYMGIEAYGLVGFFVVLQSIFNFLDIGLTPTVSRESARYRAGNINIYGYRYLIRTLERIFSFIGVFVLLVLLSLSEIIAVDWLNIDSLSILEVKTSVQLMITIVFMRWIGGLYKAIINGSEHIVWLSSFNSIIATIKFIGIIFVLKFIGATPVIFFSYQASLAFIELIVLIFYSYSIMPKVERSVHFSWSIAPIRPVIKYALSIALTSSIMIFVTQLDKVILSSILSLSKYGYFSLAVVAASGVMVLSAPVGGSIMPRMAHLEASGKHTELVSLYRKGTQLIVVIVGSAAIIISIYSEQLLLLWTKDDELTGEVYKILMLYTIGNGFLAMSAFPYYLQCAKGHLKLHIIGNLLFGSLFIPFLIWSSINYGGVGAGYAWLISNVVIFALWVPVVHRKFIPEVGLSWYTHDIFKILLPTIVVSLIFRQFLIYFPSAIGGLLFIFVASIIALITSILLSNNSIIWLKSIIFKGERI